MAQLKWYESLAIGVDFIDEDHKCLLKILTEIKETIDAGDFLKCEVLLNKLLKETKDHFAKEEAFLHKVEYPGLEKHKTYHVELLGKIEKTKSMLENTKSRDGLKECFEGIARFIFDDILQGDIHFKSYLEHEGHLDKI